jgi:hypothetical protein
MLGELSALLHGVISLTDHDDPLATGGSAIKAVEVLMEQGVPEERIIFINLVSYPMFSAHMVSFMNLRRSPPLKVSPPLHPSILCSKWYARHPCLPCRPRAGPLTDVVTHV